MNNNFLSPKQASEKLGVSKITIVRLITSGKLVANKVGHHTIRISEEALDDFIKGSVMKKKATQTTNE